MTIEYFDLIERLASKDEPDWQRTLDLIPMAELEQMVDRAEDLYYLLLRERSKRKGVSNVSG